MMMKAGRGVGWSSREQEEERKNYKQEINSKTEAEV